MALDPHRFAAQPRTVFTENNVLARVIMASASPSTPSVCCGKAYSGTGIWLSIVMMCLAFLVTVVPLLRFTCFSQCLSASLTDAFFLSFEEDFFSFPFSFAYRTFTALPPVSLLEEWHRDKTSFPLFTRYFGTREYAFMFYAACRRCLVRVFASRT